MPIATIAATGAALAVKLKLGARLLKWGKTAFSFLKGMSLTAGGGKANVSGNGYNLRLGQSGASAQVGNAVSSLSTNTLLGLGAAAYLLLKK
jgi:hypothetical protein